MAILNGIVSKLNGSAGNLTFRRSCGRTIGSEKVRNVNNGNGNAGGGDSL